MIYTVTLNPSVDYFIALHGSLIEDEVNRGSQEIYKAGGKGLNVSKTLSLYGIPSKAICLLGGFTGQYILEAFQSNRLIQIIPVHVNGVNRINMKANYGKHALVINGSGPEADDESKADLLQVLTQVNEKDYVVLAGSVMRGIDDCFIVQISRLVHQKKAYLVMDMEFKDDRLIRNCRPDLIKPNLYELRMLLHDESVNKDNIVEKTKPLLSEGIGEILVSLGKDGAMLISSHEVLVMEQPNTLLVNKVGAGDAMLASYIGQREKGLSEEAALQWAGAAGNAAASKIEDISIQDIQNYMDKIKVTAHIQ